MRLRVIANPKRKLQRQGNLPSVFGIVAFGQGFPSFGRTAGPQLEHGVIAERYRKLGGEITLIAKPGVGHHPHGLTDPKPIVDFIMAHAAHP